MGVRNHLTPTTDGTSMSRPCQQLPSRLPSNGRAFTLVELMIIIALLGILAALVVPRFGTASDQARDSGIQRQLQTVRGQIEYYVSREGQLPASVVAGTGWDDMVDSGYLVRPPKNQLRNNETSLAAGAPVAVGAATPNGAAWYFDTTNNRLYATDATGNLLDF